jgi:hypothetical protein
MIKAKENSQMSKKTVSGEAPVQTAARVIIGIILIAAWLIILLRAESYVIIYILVALSALAATIYNGCKKPVTADASYTKRRRRVTAIFSALLSLCVLLANYGLYGAITTSKVLMLLLSITVFAGGYAAFSAIITFVATAGRDRGLRHVSRKAKPGLIFIIFAAVFFISYTIVLFLCCYPGNLTPDSISQMNQLLSGEYSNHHSVFHTFLIKLFVELGLAISGNINLGVALYSIFQIVCMSCAFSYVILILYRMKISWGLIILTFIWMLVMPYNICISFTMWKDALFSAFAAVMTGALLSLINGLGKSKVCDMILFGISALGMGLFRSNGLPVLGILLIASVFTLGKKHIKLLLLLAVVCAVTFVLRGPVINHLNIKQPDILESIGVPIQQVARVIHDGEEITRQQEDLIENVAEVNVLKEKYVSTIVDDIKDYIRTEGDVAYLEAHKKDFLKLYLDIGLKHPEKYIFAWIDQTKGYWNGGYGYWQWGVHNKVWENDLGIVQTPASPEALRLLNIYVNSFGSMFFLSPFVSIGLHTWIVLILTAAGIINKRKAALAAVPTLAVILTLLAATPIYGEFRYVYPMFTSLPLVFFGTFYDNKQA